MVDFTIQGIIDIIGQTLCGGSTQLAGLLVMVAVFFVMLVIFASVKAPISYALAPMMIVDLIFGALGIIDATISMFIIIICAVLMAKSARDLVGGGSRCRSSPQAAAMTASR